MTTTPNNQSGLPFGTALEAMKQGHRVARAGWVGRGIWLSIAGVDESAGDLPHEAYWCQAEQPASPGKVLTSITMHTEQGNILMGWMDLLAEDWVIVS